MAERLLPYRGMERKLPSDEPWENALFVADTQAEIDAALAMKRSAQTASAQPMEFSASGANADHSGHAMVAWYPSADEAEQLSLADEEDAEAKSELHCTLVFLGDSAGLDNTAIEQVVAETAAEFPPFTAHVAGYAIFVNPDNRCLVALVDAPELEQLQQELHDKLLAVVPGMPDNHGYTAHITLKYLADDDDVDLMWFKRPALDVQFTGLVAKLGTERTETALTAAFDPAALTAGAQLLEFGDLPNHPFRGNQWTTQEGRQDPETLSRRALSKRSGFTYHPVTGNSPTKGWAIALPQNEEQHPASVLQNPAERVRVIQDYLDKHREEFAANPNLYLGGWNDPESKTFFLDTSVVEEDDAKAASLMAQYEQVAIYNLATGETVMNDGQ